MATGAVSAVSGKVFAEVGSDGLDGGGEPTDALRFSEPSLGSGLVVTDARSLACFEAAGRFFFLGFLLAAGETSDETSLAGAREA